MKKDAEMQNGHENHDCQVVVWLKQVPSTNDEQLSHVYSGGRRLWALCTEIALVDKDCRMSIRCRPASGFSQQMRTPLEQNETQRNEAERP
jgi:hypothetical protein